MPAGKLRGIQKNMRILPYACVQTPPQVPKILISGPPASGKGTQCEMLVKHYDVIHVSTGDMLRAAVKSETPLGVKAKSYMDSGQLVPDDLVISLLKDRLFQDDISEKGWLLDGFPRTAVQAEALDNANILPDAVLVLEVPDEVLIDRVVGRRLDPETGKIYHVKYNPPRDQNVEARLKRRSDDTEEKAKTRLTSYYKHAQSILDHYGDKVRRIDGDRSKQQVFQNLVRIIDKSDVDLESDDDQESLPPDSSSSFKSSSTQFSDTPVPSSSRTLSVSEFVRRAEDAYERGVLEAQDVNWSGQAGLDYEALGGSSSYADVSQRIGLAIGDAFMIFIFAYIGRSFHGFKAIDFGLLKTAAPFLASWFLTSPLLGCYTRAATANLSKALQSFARSWAIAIPMGIALRGKFSLNEFLMLY